MKAIRLRLAPSPTGFLHIGNLRTALFGYLLAKAQGGEFILRIEDTDEKREVAGAVDSLIKVLDWVGIKFDEGPHLGGPCAPYIQTERLAIYQEQADELLARDGAYRCFCTAERLETMRNEQAAKKQAPRYDRCCRDLSQADIQRKLAAGEKFVIRQKLPLSGEISAVDELRGQITWRAEDLEDHVLVKSNGVPTYQFASVVDDHLMAISHVTRGEEWLPSYPKNILLYQAFGWTPPKFLHLPLILNKGGGKLSKRQGDVFVEDYRQKGYLAEALINFCALLGWHDKSDQEIFSLEQLCQAFSVEGMGISPAVFDLEKLDYLNGYYIRQKTNAELLALAKPYLSELLAAAPSWAQGEAYLEAALGTVKERLKRLNELPAVTAFYFHEQLSFDHELLAWKTLTVAAAKDNLRQLLPVLTAVAADDWQQDKLNTLLLDWIKNQGGKNGDYLWPLRVALTGEKASPSPFEVMGVIGQAQSLARLQAILD